MTRQIAMPARRTLVWLAVAAGLLLVAGANAHLVYVAATSQPDCVSHVRTGDMTQAGGQIERREVVMHRAMTRFYAAHAERDER